MPPTPVSTELARGPAARPRCRTPTPRPTPAGPPLLVAALAGQPEHLLLATRDYLHQEYRRAGDARVARPRRRAARRRACPPIVSGAGPTVLAFTDGGRRPAACSSAARAGWAAHHLAVDRDGARLT